MGETTGPLVTVIIPAYNHAMFVERAIQSVLGQTYQSIELIVVDDGSKDDTWKVIRRVHAAHGGVFQIATKPNRGVSHSLNLAMARTKGELVALLASDDYFLLEKIERQVCLMLERGPTVGLVHCSALEDYGDGRLLPMRGRFAPAEGFCFRQLVSREVAAIAPSILFRREAYERTQGFDERLVGEDRDFYVAVAAAGYAFAFDPTPMLVKRTGKDNLGTRVDLFFRDPFVTLAKYRDQFDAAEYARIENGFYRGMGRAAAGVGLLGLSFRSYRTLAQRTGSAKPYLQFLARAGRRFVVAALPQQVIGRLRDVRSRRALLKR